MRGHIESAKTVTGSILGREERGFVGRAMILSAMLDIGPELSATNGVAFLVAVRQIWPRDFCLTGNTGPIWSETYDAYI